MLKISLAIPAHNAEPNIKNIAQALLRQKGADFTITEIIIHSDQSTDDTLSQARQIADPRLRLLASPQRQGFAGSLKTILETAGGDIVAVFNDDIKIDDPELLIKLTRPFVRETNVGLVCGRPYPLPAKNFIDSAIFSTYRAYDRMRRQLANPHNEFTCDGKILLFSRSFISSLKFPEDYRLMGNVDAFLYFACLANGFVYQHVPGAVVYYRNPTTIRDYIRWTSRNNSNKELLKNYFGQLVEQEYAMPRSVFLRSAIREFFRNPTGTTFIFVMRYYIKFLSRKLSKNFNTTWEPVSSTKRL